MSGARPRTLASWFGDGTHSVASGLSGAMVMLLVMPAKAGIQYVDKLRSCLLDSRLRGNDSSVRRKN